MDFSWFYAKNAGYVTPYSTPHILYLLFCFTVIFLFVYYRKAVAKHREQFCRVALVVLSFQQVVLLYGWYAVFTGFDLSQSLPLHICRVASMLTFVLLGKRDTRYLDVIFYFSVYALSSFFYPKNVYHFAHINGISYMVNHLLTVLVPIFGAIAYDWRPSWGACRKAWLAFTAYFALVCVVNPLVGGNYFYLVDRPFFSDWSIPAYYSLAYFGTMIGFGLITAGFMYVSVHKKQPKHTPITV